LKIDSIGFEEFYKAAVQFLLVGMWIFSRQRRFQFHETCFIVAGKFAHDFFLRIGATRLIGMPQAVLI
jgi:hypothetical protein